MKTTLSTTLVLSCVLFILGFSQLALAVPTIDRTNPEQMLKEATDALLQTSKDARSYVHTDRARYYAEVSSVLDQVLNKDYFARAVMATYGSSRLYKSLETQAEKDIFKQRVELFSRAMEKVLIEKYADALLTFNGERIDIDALNDENGDSRKARVQQKIYDDGDKTYLVQYSLHQDSKGLWLINNVIVEGINMGGTYRSQFAEAMEKNRGDIDYVINNWAALMQSANRKVESQATEEAATPSTTPSTTPTAGEAGE